ncbi:hypothetical protein FKO01_60555 [Mesorhizobium sp. B2-3-3]|uniref:hypothetical protein n=1 Tax=Streptomyces sp. NPDC002238 TaxID=3156649 RepID=UPI001167EA75|nr:hypothetical protein FKO01_60555 [Mesorhizobium sp. B2-3-3]
MAASPDRNARHLQLLAALVTQRRAALDLGKDEAARKCGIAPMTYRAVEEGRRARDTTYAKIEKAFEFAPGACRAVLDGSDSIKLLDGTELIHGAQIARPSLEDLADEVQQAVTKAAGLHAPDLTHRQTQEMTGEIVDELRRRGILPSAP